MGIRSAHKRRNRKPSQRELDRRRLQSHLKQIDNIRSPLTSDTLEVKRELQEAQLKYHLTPNK